jgi:hypothetical protein
MGDTRCIIGTSTRVRTGGGVHSLQQSLGVGTHPGRLRYQGEIWVAKSRVVDVECRCGQHLFKYCKGGRGRLIKCFLGEIREDHAGLTEQPLGARPCCPDCGKELGRVCIVRGRPGLKLNQGTVKGVRI